MENKVTRVPKNKFTQDQFIEKCKEKHNNFYDYSKVIYTRTSDYITVICPANGEYTVRAANHLRGDGCKNCYRDRQGLASRKGSKYYLEKIENMYGGNISVLSGDIVTNKSVIDILCKKHNERMSVSVQAITAGNTCKHCKSEMLSSIAESKRNKKIGEFLGKFEHIKVLEMKVFKEESKFYCSKHSKHFSKCLANVIYKDWIGCDECWYEKFSYKIYSKQNKERLLEVKNSPSLFNYTFEKFNYTGDTNKVVITCIKHGDFEVSYNQRVKGQSYGECPVCMYEFSRIELLRDFVQKAKVIHGDSYDYSLIKTYTNCKDNVTIICNGCEKVFMQTPDNHLQGKGCSECNSVGHYIRSRYIEHSNKNYGGFCSLYLIECSDEKELFYKVGITVKSLSERFGSSVHMPYNFNSIEIIRGRVEEIIDLEYSIHKAVKEYHYLPNISFGGHVKECFTESGLDIAKQMIQDYKLNYKGDSIEN